MIAIAAIQIAIHLFACGMFWAVCTRRRWQDAGMAIFFVSAVVVLVRRFGMFVPTQFALHDLIDILTPMLSSLLLSFGAMASLLIPWMPTKENPNGPLSTELRGHAG